jgi:hypothetical protein
VQKVLGRVKDQPRLDPVDFDAGEVYIGEQLQRVRRQLLRREVKTETSEAPSEATRDALRKLSDWLA